MWESRALIEPESWYVVSSMSRYCFGGVRLCFTHHGIGSSIGIGREQDQRGEYSE
jgi:hypothetical protein